MKKFLLPSLAIALILSSCGTATQVVNQTPSQDVSSFASSTKKMTMDKKDAGATKKSEIVNKGGKDLGTKSQASGQRNASKVEVSYKDVKSSNSSESFAAATANFALRSMDQSQTYESGAKIGYKALEDLSLQNVYVAKLTYATARATTTWEDAYKIMAIGLRTIADQKPNTPQTACDLVLTMLEKVKTYESGARAGYAAIEFIGQTDNQQVRSFLATVYNSAKSARTWDDAYRTIVNGVQTLKTLF